MSDPRPHEAFPDKDSQEARYGRPDPPDWRRYTKLGVWIVLVIIAVAFIVANSQEVEVSFVFASAAMPLYVALLITLALGLLIGIGGVWFLRRRKAKKAVKAQE